MWAYTSILAPIFWLPNAISITRVLGFNYESVDIDLVEFFLNFPLIQFLHKYSGVDLTPTLDDLLLSFLYFKKIVRNGRLTG